jgi:hypothetical protein
MRLECSKITVFQVRARACLRYVPAPSDWPNPKNTLTESQCLAADLHPVLHLCDMQQTPGVTAATNRVG